MNAGETESEKIGTGILMDLMIPGLSYGEKYALPHNVHPYLVADYLNTGVGSEGLIGRARTGCRCHFSCLFTGNILSFPPYLQHPFLSSPATPEQPIPGGCTARASLSCFFRDIPSLHRGGGRVNFSSPASSLLLL